MVYTERAPRRQQFHVAPAIATIKQRCQYTTAVDIKTRAIKGYSHSFRVTSEKSTASLQGSGEERCIKAISDNDNHKGHTHVVDAVGGGGEVAGDADDARKLVN